jgi:putative N-acetylmannosamine-6-phosphate epimerase
VIDEVVSFVLHNRLPVAVVDKVDVPLQLSTTVTIGVEGVVFGAATPEPAALVQPFADCVTVYVPAEGTVIDEVVSFVFHNRLPVAVVDKVDVPLQLSTTVTTGVDGVVFGEATPEPAALVQPFADCVTVYVPAEGTVIDEVVSFVFHNRLPVAVVDKVDVPLQLSTTVTTGVDGVVFGAATPEPAALMQPFTDCVTV